MTDIQKFRRDPNRPVAQQLEELLRGYGLKEKLPLQDELVDLQALVELLPAQLPSGINPAHKELSEYYYSIPPRRRSLGVALHPDHLLSLLQDRLEFFEGLARGLVRICRGRSCPHFRVCPYAPLVATVTEGDGELCAVDRDVIRKAVEDFVQPPDGQKPKVDPRRPEMALLFQQLVGLLVKQRRIAMYMQIEPALIDYYEILKDGDMERFDTMNRIEHPLMVAWDRNTTMIQKVMRDMGITMEFQIKQGLLLDDQSQVDSERRAREMLLNYLRDGRQRLLAARENAAPEHLPQIESTLEALDLLERTARTSEGAT